MASLEQIDLGRVVSELVQGLHRARGRKRQVERLLERIAGMMAALGLDSVCLGGAVVRRGRDGEGNDELYYTVDMEKLREIHDRLAQARYYSELLAELDELRPFLDNATVEKAELVKQHLDRLLESLKCREV